VQIVEGLRPVWERLRSQLPRSDFRAGT
jgi:hypothetical protein